MSCYDEVLKIGKKLDKMVSSKTTDSSTALDMMKALKQQPMTLEVLQKTRIGMTVNNFRKACDSGNEEAVSLAKALIKSWKKLLPENSSQTSSQKESQSQPKDESKASDSPKEDAPQTPSTPTSPTSPSFTRQVSFPAKAEDTTDSVRLKCRELLADAFKRQPLPEGYCGNVEELAAAIEDNIFKEFENTDQKYKARVRSRVSNIRDPKNPRLRENVLIGFITPEKIAGMTAEEMASDALKEMRAKFTKEAINDHQMAVTSGTTTDLLKCGKCQKRNCTYNQVQTRSADEPMTTFVLCNNCGNRWKFC